MGGEPDVGLPLQEESASGVSTYVAVRERPRAKGRNLMLGSWFERSGWSKGELARMVNRRARQLGAGHVSTDTSRVRRWLDGEQPREPIPRILTELFGERFGCVVTGADLGLREPMTTAGGSVIDLPWSADQTVELLGEFTRSDLLLNRRGFLGTSLALSAGPALVEPMRRWLEPPAPPAPRSGIPRTAGRLSGTELEQLESTARLFRVWDAQCGGGLRRMAVVGQVHELTELLHDGYPDGMRRRLFAIAAELALVAGWMSYDIGMQPSAQRYFVLGLHAAKEAGDRPLGAEILGAMSRQMIHLNRSHDALDLIALAQRGLDAPVRLRPAAVPPATPRVRAMLAALEGRANAGLGRIPDSEAAADRAAEAIAEADRYEDPDWIRYFSAAELDAENGHSLRDLAYRDPSLAPRAVAVLDRAIDGFAAGGTEYVRSTALNLVGRASADLLCDEPERAADAMDRALSIAVRIRSRRVDDRIRATSTAAAARYPDLMTIRELRERVMDALPEPA